VIKTRLLQVDPRDPPLAVLKEAAGVLLKGGLVAFPTETFYGLGANALDAAAVKRIFEVKGRPESKPLVVLVDSVRMAESLVKEIPPAALALMARYWPGPLTLIFRSASCLPEELTAATGTIGIRISGHPVAFELVRAAGVPITAPSANPSGEEPPIRAIFPAAKHCRDVGDGAVTVWIFFHHPSAVGGDKLAQILGGLDCLRQPKELTVKSLPSALYFFGMQPRLHCCKVPLQLRRLRNHVSSPLFGAHERLSLLRPKKETSA